MAPFTFIPLRFSRNSILSDIYDEVCTHWRQKHLLLHDEALLLLIVLDDVLAQLVELHLFQKHVFRDFERSS